MIKTLVIEDRNSHLECLSGILDPAEYSLYFSHDKEDGVQIALKYPQDLIIFHLSIFSDVQRVRRLVENNDLLCPVIVIPQSPSPAEQRQIMELGAEDYIPVEFLDKSLNATIKNRLARITKLEQRVREQVNDLEETASNNMRDDHILVKLGTKLKLIKFTDIIYITAMKEYSKIKSVNSPDVLVRKSMRNWVKLLPKSFLRIHRATIINLDYIEKISNSSGRIYTVSLKGVKETFDFSYRYTNIMRRTFPT